MFKKLSVIGVGHIARAFLSAVTAGDGAFTPADVTLWNRTPEHIDDLIRAGHPRAKTPEDAFVAGELVLLGVKPQNYAALLSRIAEAGCDPAGRIVITPAAGVSSAAVSERLGGCGVVRIMPNTPIAIRRGVIAVCQNGRVPDKAFQEICRLLSRCGSVYRVAETEMDGMTAATSSATAYVYRFIRAITEAGRSCGVDLPQLEKAVAETFIGASELLLSSGKPAEELIAAVRSPNGTTEQALAAFDRLGLERIVEKAMLACADRAGELGRESLPQNKNN